MALELLVQLAGLYFQLRQPVQLLRRGRHHRSISLLGNQTWEHSRTGARLAAV